MILLDAVPLAVVLGFMALLIALLAPLIPSVLLYKVFPDTKVTAQGPLAGLTVRASGAFAAYLILVLLAFWYLRGVDRIISSMVAETWTVQIPIQLIDENNNQITTGLDAVKGVGVEFSPPIHALTHTKVTLTVPVEHGRWRTVLFSLHGFESVDLPLAELVERKEAMDLDQANHRVTLHSPVRFVKVPPKLQEKPYQPPGALKPSDEQTLRALQDAIRPK